MGRAVRRRPVAVIGAGWAGATAARCLTDAGCPTHVLEQGLTVGGHSRSERLNDVVYEPNGPHIFHTSNPEVARLVQRFGMARPYQLVVLTEVFLSDFDDAPRLLSWPLQMEELKDLPIWRQVERELSALPDQPRHDDFERYCLSTMGRTLYELFVKGYTEKQWGRDPASLSSKFAPRRLELRTDGYRRLFRDRWEFFPPNGSQEVIERMLEDVPITVGRRITIEDLEDLQRDHAAIVVTAALDDFAGRPGALQWRGIRTESEYVPVSEPSLTATPTYIVNRPSPRIPYTRTVESKHATGQRAMATVVSREYPGADARQYPVLTPDNRYEKVNAELQALIEERADVPVLFCGRLANYTYINQDQAIGQGMECAQRVMRRLAR